VFVTETLTAGIAAPEESLTLPRMEPSVPDWAAATWAVASKMVKAIDSFIAPPVIWN
jgi:hypothetical protein